MEIIYAGQPFLPSWAAAIFLAGPTPRSSLVPSWRPEALELLRAAGFRGVVFLPESASGDQAPEYEDQVEWEQQGLNFADRILFWIPRQLETMPAFTTNVEFGRWCTSGKAILGYPPSAPKTKYLGWLAQVEGVPVCHTLAETVAAALDGIGNGVERSGCERYIPLRVWRSERFQEWYRLLRAAGDRLEVARVLWSFGGPGERPILAHVMHVKIWSAAEQDYKENKWVLAWPDGS